MEWWGIDLTKLLVQGFGWVSIGVGLNGDTKAIVGSHAGSQSTARHWRAALDMAVTCQFPQGVQAQGLSLMSDHGGQPTSTACMRACGTLAIQQALTSDHHPQVHADTERVMRTLHAECLCRHKWTYPFS